MIQLRLAWWRDRLAEPAGQRPKGEPLLARLALWDGQTAALIALVNGWEAKIVGEDGGAELARARTEAFVALGQLVGAVDAAAIRLTAQGLADPASAELAPALPRTMRPLAVLRAMALRDARGGKPTPFADIARVVRVGLLGR
jgi:phytoene synthase